MYVIGEVEDGQVHETIWNTRGMPCCTFKKQLQRIVFFINFGEDNYHTTWLVLTLGGRDHPTNVIWCDSDKISKDFWLSPLVALSHAAVRLASKALRTFETQSQSHFAHLGN